MKLICLTGAESTGKSTLSTQLAQHYKCLSLPEYARIYLNEFGPEYNFNDLRKIAEEQHKRILDFSKSSLAIGFLDTDLLTLIIWSEYVFGKTDPYIQQSFQKNRVDLYLLCNPDLVWEPDPLREHPTERNRIHLIYKHELKKRRLPFQCIKGQGEERFSSALKIIENPKLF